LILQRYRRFQRALLRVVDPERIDGERGGPVKNAGHFRLERPDGFLCHLVQGHLQGALGCWTAQLFERLQRIIQTIRLDVVSPLPCSASQTPALRASHRAHNPLATSAPRQATTLPSAAAEYRLLPQPIDSITVQNPKTADAPVRSSTRRTSSLTASPAASA